METLAIREQLEEDIVIEHKRSRGNPSFPYHRHRGCEIYLFLEGNIRFFIEKTCFSPVPGMLIILNPNEMHRIEGLDNNRYERITVNIRQEYMASLSRTGFDLSRCFHDRVNGENNIRQLSAEQEEEFKKICLEIKRHSGDRPARMLRREAWTSLLLVFVNEIFVGEQMDVENMMPEYLSEAMRYMEEHINGPLQLTRMAEKLGLHPVYLSSQFKRYTGLTVRNYHIDRRITRARMLLEKGLNVSEACMEAGFNDYANFIRTFKKRTGLTPGTFRRTRPSRQTGG